MTSHALFGLSSDTRVSTQMELCWSKPQVHAESSKPSLHERSAFMIHDGSRWISCDNYATIEYGSNLLVQFVELFYVEFSGA